MILQVLYLISFLFKIQNQSAVMFPLSMFILNNKKLRTAFTFVINNEIGEQYHLHTTDIIDLKVPSLPRSHLHNRHVKNQTVNQHSCWEYLFKLNRYLIENTPDAINSIRTQICSLNMRSLKIFNEIFIMNYNEFHFILNIYSGSKQHSTH